MLKRNKIVSNFLVMIISFQLIFALGEIIIRSNLKFHSNGYRISKNKKLVYELIPASYIEHLNALINLQGFNDINFNKAKAPGIFRIAVVGDSVSFGWKMWQEEAFPKRLEHHLNKRQEKRYEVYNFSVPGYNTAQERELLKERVISYDPDMAILVFCPNDIEMPYLFKPKVTFFNYLHNRSFFLHYLLYRLDLLLKDKREESPTKKIWSYFKKHILSMFFYEQDIYITPGLELPIFRNGRAPFTKDLVPKEYQYMVGYENYKKHLGDIKEFLEFNKIQFISSGFFTKKAYRINKEIGISPIINFYLEIIGYNNENKSNLTVPADYHANAKVHDLIAKSIVQHIK